MPIDLGPGAGVRGGCVVGRGRVDDLLRNPESITGRYLREPLQHGAAPRRPVDKKTASIVVEQASLHQSVGTRCAYSARSAGRRSPAFPVRVNPRLARDVLFASARALVGGGGGPIGCRATRDRGG
jgi:excinuclease ABC subunit A